jgi:hypothetical protein
VCPVRHVGELRSVREFCFESSCAVKTRVGYVGPDLTRDHGSVGLRFLGRGSELLLSRKKVAASSFFHLLAHEPRPYRGPMGVVAIHMSVWRGGSRGRPTGERAEFAMELIERVSGGGALRHVR